MVTAGVFLVIRSSIFFEVSELTSKFLVIVGLITTVISGLIGIAQNDIKKIIAYSTCSQLGYMVTSCGLMEYGSSLFHLFTHAFFKALLFLTAGSFIHLLSGEQDIRKIGGALTYTPFLSFSLLLGSAALAGVPFTAGFYSKDAILEASIVSSKHNVWVYFSLIFAATLTVQYSLRIFDQVCSGGFTGFKSSLFQTNSCSRLELYVLGTLFFLAITSGYFAKELFLGPGSTIFASHKLACDNFATNFDYELISGRIKAVPVLVIFLVLEYENRCFTGRWFFNELINNFIAIPTFQFSKVVYEQGEKRLTDNLGPLYFSNLIRTVRLTEANIKKGLLTK